MEAAKLVEITRGDIVESIHRGFIAVVDIEGKVIASKGDYNFETFIRSAAKPIQAVPVVERGAKDFFQFTEPELAVMVASHSGEAEHQDAVQGILKKIGLKTSNLLCGVSKPIHKPTANRLLLEGKKPESIHCPCSGKHAGMLALAVYEKYNIENYFLLEHPVQQIMLETMADFAEVKKEKIKIGIDGCGVPVFGISVKAMAQAYANFSNPVKYNEKRKRACKILNKAMLNYPGIVAGTNRLTTLLMKQLGTRVIAKDGSEAVFCLGIPEKNWGVAIKIEDGGARALGPVILSVLDQLGVLTKVDKEVLKKYYYPEVKNYRGEVIGKIKPVFELNT